MVPQPFSGFSTQPPFLSSTPPTFSHQHRAAAIPLYRASLYIIVPRPPTLRAAFILRNWGQRSSLNSYVFYCLVLRIMKSTWWDHTINFSNGFMLSPKPLRTYLPTFSTLHLRKRSPPTANMDIILRYKFFISSAAPLSLSLSLSLSLLMSPREAQLGNGKPV